MNIFKSKWGEWIDLSTGVGANYIYLLQARRHKNGKIQFRVERSSLLLNCECPTIEQLKSVVFY